MNRLSAPNMLSRSSVEEDDDCSGPGVGIRCGVAIALGTSTWLFYCANSSAGVSIFRDCVGNPLLKN